MVTAIRVPTRVVEISNMLFSGEKDRLSKLWSARQIVIRNGLISATSASTAFLRRFLRSFPYLNAASM
jgi:hypothetical protein